MSRSVAALLLLLLVGCGSGSGDAARATPERVARFPDERPFDVEREVELGDGPSAEEISDFTRRLLEFYAGSDFFRWTRRVSHGVAEDNPWGEPPYLFWWQDIEAVKQGDLVTFRHIGGQDNMMSHHGRVFGPLVGAWLTLPETDRTGALRELVLGYIRGVSATFTGSVWAEEDPVVESIMARAIFHRNHSFELDGGRRAAVDYEPERRHEIERRHDTVHNPRNPTWGDIWVRNKRSKDDFPWVYRMQIHLARILRGVDDAEVREAALTLHDQLQAMSRDILEHGYVIRSKTDGGEIFIPWLSQPLRIVDDFASMVVFEFLVPGAECTAKLPVALIATGEAQGNDCGDGRSTLAEEVGLARFYGHTWMGWNFHISAIGVALLHGEHDAARRMLVGLGRRMDALATRDDDIANDPRFDPDVAQTLVLAATYGLPLTADEARSVIDQYRRAADHHQPWPLWDLWNEAVPDGTYEYLPGRRHEDRSRAHIHIEEMGNLFEYCASPVRARDGAQFVDCDLLTASAAWR